MAHTVECKRIKKLASSQRWNVWLCECNGQKAIEKTLAYTITQKEIEYYTKRAKIWLKELNKNPYIAQLLDFDENNARFIIKHYPKTLRQILNKRGKLPASVAKGIILRIAEALRHAHEIGVVHGDIKPENILLDETNTPKLGDWEDAILIMEEDNIVQYTPGYETPEQRKRDPTIIDEKTDIYQLGILLYEIIEGTKLEKLTFARTPQYIRPIIAKCLKQNPDERYQTVDELIAELRIQKAPPTQTVATVAILEKSELMKLPPIDRIKKYLEEIDNKPLAISIGKIAQKLGLTTQQVRAAINIVARKRGVAIVEGKIITIPGLVQLALKTKKPIARILARQKLPVEWWQRLLKEIERQNVAVPFGDPIVLGAVEKSEKIRAKVAICAGYAVPKTIEQQILGYIGERKTTPKLIQDVSLAFGLAPQVIQAIKTKHKLVIFEYKHGNSVLSVSWSPDGRFLATGSGDSCVRVFRVGDWVRIFEHKHGGLSLIHI